MTIISHDIFLNTADSRKINPLPPPVSVLRSVVVTPAPPTFGSNLAVGQFQDLRDTGNLIKSKPVMFWCYTHLQDLPLEKQSPDPRYCKNCYQVLADESADMKAAGIRRKPWWMPNDAGEKNVKVLEQPLQNMSTLKAQNSTVDKLSRPVIIRRGPKSKALPLERIAKLAADGMGSKLIARQLNANGIEVSYKTIQRLLKKVKA
jgi:hypothetical protein